MKFRHSLLFLCTAGIVFFQSSLLVNAKESQTTSVFRQFDKKYHADGSEFFIIKKHRSRLDKKFPLRVSPSFNPPKTVSRKPLPQSKKGGAAYNPVFAYIVMDVDSGTILKSSNADARTYPASLTKMMTCYLTFEAIKSGKLSLNQRLKISKRAASQHPGKLWLKSGQTITVKDALYGTLIHSANDAAVVLGEALGGTEEHFAYLMTRKARQLGMYQTFFKNASGLPDNRQITTARDMLTLATALYRHFPEFYHIVGNTRFVYKGKAFTTTNRLLSQVEGVDGIKTGYIRLSGYNLAASAVRGGKRIIAVLMGGKTSRWRNQRMTELINSTFKELHIVSSGKKHSSLKIIESKHPIPTRVVDYASENSKFVSPPRLPQAKLTSKIEETEQKEKIKTEGLTQQSKDQYQKITEVRPLPLIKQLQVSNAEETVPQETSSDSKTPSKSIVLKKNWGMQIGSFQSAKQAYLKADTVNETHGLDGKVSIKRIGKGTRSLYQARIKELSEKLALETCQTLKNTGGECILLPPKV